MMGAVAMRQVLPVSARACLESASLVGSSLYAVGWQALRPCDEPPFMYLLGLEHGETLPLTQIRPSLCGRLPFCFAAAKRVGCAAGFALLSPDAVMGSAACLRLQYCLPDYTHIVRPPWLGERMCMRRPVA